MTRAASSVVSPIISVDRLSPIALHRQIYDSYRRAILEGMVRPGQQIPSTRVLANELGISRFPVLDAYSQLLAEGYFESRVGSGTIISHSLPERFTRSSAASPALVTERDGPRHVAGRSALLPLYQRSPWTRETGPFGVGQVAFDEFPIQVWSKLITRHSRNLNPSTLFYNEHMGSIDLREVIAGYLRTARSVRCDADQVMIVSGSQQALELSVRVLLDAGSPVWFEEPGYLFARDAFLLGGCDLVPVPVDENGLNVEAGISQQPNARAAFVTPSHQFPLGFTMSPERRLQLLNWAHNTGAWIIEDDYDSEYRYDKSPIASLQGLDPNGRVIYIGTFSKVLFPSLRLGYVVIPRDLVSRFLTVRHAMDLGPPVFYQDVVSDFMREGHFGRHIRKMRVAYRERRMALVKSVADELGSAVQIFGGEAGMHLTIKLRDSQSDVEIAERAAAQHLWLWPLSTFYLQQPSSAGFILGFGGTPVASIPAAVRKLRGLISAGRGIPCTDPLPTDPLPTDPAPMSKNGSEL